MKKMECTWIDGKQTITLLRVISLDIDLEKGKIIAHTDEKKTMYSSNKYVFSKDKMKNIRVEIEKDK